MHAGLRRQNLGIRGGVGIVDAGDAQGKLAAWVRRAHADEAARRSPPGRLGVARGGGLEQGHANGICRVLSRRLDDHTRTR